MVLHLGRSADCSLCLASADLALSSHTQQDCKNLLPGSAVLWTWDADPEFAVWGGGGREVAGAAAEQVEPAEGRRPKAGDGTRASSPLPPQRPTARARCPMSAVAALGARGGMSRSCTCCAILQVTCCAILQVAHVYLYFDVRLQHDVAA